MCSREMCHDKVVCLSVRKAPVVRVKALDTNTTQSTRGARYAKMQRGGRDARTTRPNAESFGGVHTL